jgi:hypothetical protein
MSNSHQLRIFQNAHTYENYSETDTEFAIKIRKERILPVFVMYITTYILKNFVICAGCIVLVEQRNLGRFDGLDMFREARNIYRIIVDSDC